MKCQPTFLCPTYRVLRIPPVVFIQPKISSTRLRRRRLILYPGWHVVRPSMADSRLLVFWATRNHLHLAGRPDEGVVVVSLVAPDRDPAMLLPHAGQHVQRRLAFRRPRRQLKARVDYQPVPVLYHQNPVEEFLRHFRGKQSLLVLGESGRIPDVVFQRQPDEPAKQCRGEFAPSGGGCCGSSRTPEAGAP